MNTVARHSGKLSVTPIDGGWAVSGEIDANTAPVLVDALQVDRTDPQTSILVLDLADVEFIDSSGLRVLLDARRRSDALGGSVVLRQPSPSVRRLIEITNLQSAFDIEVAETTAGADAHAT